MNTPLISVIIPVYKVEKYLPRCLDSIIIQTYKNLEIICVNDGSPDICLSILREYAEKDSRIIVLDQENQGVSAARNNGLKLATGEVIAYIDSDDWIHPLYFETMITCMEETNADVVFCEGTKVYDDESSEELNALKEKARRISVQEAFSLWTVRHCVWARLYKRSVLNSHEFASEIRIGDDTMFNLDVLCHIRDPILYYIPEKLYYWFIRRDSITHTVKPGGVLGEAEWYVKHLDQEEKTGAEWLLLEQAIKAALSARYSEMFSADAKSYKAKANILLRQFIPLFRKSRFVPLKNKILLTVMYQCPFLYRIWRWIDDPTMLQWERNMKRKQAAAQAE